MPNFLWTLSVMLLSELTLLENTRLDCICDAISLVGNLLRSMFPCVALSICRWPKGFLFFKDNLLIMYTVYYNVGLLIYSCKASCNIVAFFPYMCNLLICRIIKTFQIEDNYCYFCCCWTAMRAPLNVFIISSSHTWAQCELNAPPIGPFRNNTTRREIACQIDEP